MLPTRRLVMAGGAAHRASVGVAVIVAAGLVKLIQRGRTILIRERSETSIRTLRIASGRFAVTPTRAPFRTSDRSARAVPEVLPLPGGLWIGSTVSPFAPMIAILPATGSATGIRGRSDVFQTSARPGAMAMPG